MIAIGNYAIISATLMVTCYTSQADTIYIRSMLRLAYELILRSYRGELGVHRRDTAGSVQAVETRAPLL